MIFSLTPIDAQVMLTSKILKELLNHETYCQAIKSQQLSTKYIGILGISADLVFCPTPPLIHIRFETKKDTFDYETD